MDRTEQLLELQLENNVPPETYKQFQFYSFTRTTSLQNDSTVKIGKYVFVDDNYALVTDLIGDVVLLSVLTYNHKLGRWQHSGNWEIKNIGNLFSVDLPISYEKAAGASVLFSSLGSSNYSPKKESKPTKQITQSKLSKWW